MHLPRLSSTAPISGNIGPWSISYREKVNPITEGLVCIEFKIVITILRFKGNFMLSLNFRENLAI